MADKNTRFATEALLKNGVTFDSQGKPQLSPTANKVMDAYRKQLGAQDNVNISRLPGEMGGVAWSPTQISVTDNADVRVLAHELTHTTQPEITGVGKIKGVLSGQPVTAAPLGYLDEPLNKLTRAVTKPTKSDLLNSYTHRVQKTFESEVDAQRGMKDLIQKVIPSYNPEARKSAPGEFESGKAQGADGWNYSAYPASYMEKAINEARRLGRNDSDFNSNVAKTRWDYNTYMKDKMGTTYSPNPYK